MSQKSSFNSENWGGDQINTQECPFCGEPIPSNKFNSHLPCDGVREGDDDLALADGGEHP